MSPIHLHHCTKCSLVCLSFIWTIRKVLLISLLSLLRHCSLRHLVALSNDNPLHVPPTISDTILYALRSSHCVAPVDKKGNLARLHAAGVSVCTVTKGGIMSVVVQNDVIILDLSVKDLLSIIPSHWFQRSALRSSLYILWDSLLVQFIKLPCISNPSSLWSTSLFFLPPPILFPACPLVNLRLHHRSRCN